MINLGFDSVDLMVMVMVMVTIVHFSFSFFSFLDIRDEIDLRV